MDLSAESVLYDRNTDLYIAKTKVIITGGNTRLEADYVEFPIPPKRWSQKDM